MATIYRRLKIRRDTAANFTAANPVLADGEPALETDTRKRKIGDGVTAWNSLAYNGSGALSNRDTVNVDYIDDGAVTTAKLASTRSLLASDGTTTGTATFPAISGTVVNQGMGMFNSDSEFAVTSLSAWKTATGLDAQGLIDSISTVLGTGWQTGEGGGGTTVPATFGTGDWTLTDPATTGDLTATLNTLPSDGGSAITALQYRLDGGTAVSFSGTGTGARTISGLTDDVEYDVEVRAVNAVGNGAWSAVKSATPTAPAGYTPVYVTLSGATLSVPQDFTTDSNKFTFAYSGNRANTTGTKYIWAFPGRSSIQVSGGTIQVALVSTTNSVLYEGDFNIGTGAHAFAISADLSVPSVEIRVDGTLLTVTGDPATGIDELTAPTSGSIDWTQGTGTFSFFTEGPVDLDGTVSDMFWETGAARATSLFFSGSAITDWGGTIGTPQIAVGGGRSAADWNNDLHDGSATISAAGFS